MSGNRESVIVDYLLFALPGELHSRGLCSCPAEESDACPDLTTQRIRDAIRDMAAEAEVEAEHSV